MPKSTQLLYFHLIMNADDDGIVEAFNVMNLINSPEDDLKILVAKNYVQILNDDQVCLIIDWKEHNLIRADRKSDSIYKSLLINDRGQMPVKCPANVRQMPAQVSIGKVRLGKDSKDSSSSQVQTDEQQEEINNLKENKIPYQQIIDLYHEILRPLGFTRVKILTDDRKRKIKSRWNNELPTIEQWNEYFSDVSRSDFLCGRKTGSNGKPFYADFDWLICPSNCAKVLEDKYSNERY